MPELGSTKLKAAHTCSYPGCDSPAPDNCDSCESWFCFDHGSTGGDVESHEIGPVAVPALCWACGGFNYDQP